MKTKLMQFIGTKTFYKTTLKIALPIMIQNSISFFINFIDNIMVGQLGTTAMSGVAITNQFIFVFQTCILGIISGASIYGTQFYGSRDIDGLKGTFRFRIISCMMLTLIFLALFVLSGDQLILLFLHSQNQEELIHTLYYGKQYLAIILISLIPAALTQAYASTSKDTGMTFLPMLSSVIAVILNTILNYLLIFGKFGFPKLGVEGAAIATVIARIVECVIIVLVVHLQQNKYIFSVGAYRSLKVEKALVRKITKTGIPLLINELIWSVGTVLVVQCYSVRGIHVIASMNIATTIFNIFNIFSIIYIAVGNCIAIMVGQLLGAGKMDEALDTDRKLIFLAVTSSLIITIFMAVSAPFIPSLYDTTIEVQTLATNLILILALYIPITTLVHAEFFTIRAGGKTLITFLFDSSVLWLLRIPLAFYLSGYTNIHIIYIYFICQMTEVIKGIIGFILVRKKIWLHKITT